MQFYNLEFFGLKRSLPIVALGPKVKIASVNLLGDRELVNKAAEKLVEKIVNIDFDYLIGPEVTVLPLIHEISNILKHDRYVICRKGVKGYMVKPVVSDTKPSLVINGVDADMIRGKKVLLVDDVVTSGKTIRIMKDLLSKVDAEIVKSIAIFKQGEDPVKDIEDFLFLQRLPVFTKSKK